MVGFTAMDIVVCVTVFEIEDSEVINSDNVDTGAVDGLGVWNTVFESGKVGVESADVDTGFDGTSGGWDTVEIGDGLFTDGEDVDKGGDGVPEDWVAVFGITS